MAKNNQTAPTGQGTPAATATPAEKKTRKPRVLHPAIAAAVAQVKEEKRVLKILSLMCGLGEASLKIIADAAKPYAVSPTA